MDTRFEIQRLLAACRHDPDVPENLFRLLEAVVTRLDAAFPSEMPTRPDRPRMTPAPIPRVINPPLPKR